MSFAKLTIVTDLQTKALAFGVVSRDGSKSSGTANWSSSFNSTSQWYEIAIKGEKYFLRDYTTVVTPSFGSGKSGSCNSSSIDNKLLISCYDNSGNPAVPAALSFVSFKNSGQAAGSGNLLAFGVVSRDGSKSSGTANWSSSFNSTSQWYEIAIKGEKYFLRDYTTVVTPSFGSGESGSCNSSSVDNKLLISCYDDIGNSVVPAALSFVTYYQEP